MTLQTITKFVVSCSCDKFFKGLQTYFKIEHRGVTVSNHCLPNVDFTNKNANILRNKVLFQQMETLVVTCLCPIIIMSLGM